VNWERLLMGTATFIYGHNVEGMVRRLTASTDALDSLRPDDTVVIKPNLVASKREWRGVNTDPRVVEAFVKVLKDRGINRITVGDGSGMGSSATKAFQICGYVDLAKRYGLRLVDLERDRFVRKAVPFDGPFDTLEIAQTVLECDFLINVPLIKAHVSTLITCSLKNLKGIMPRQIKTAFHREGLHRSIAQLASIVSPDLILVDGRQGNISSETGRDLVALETMLLGTNPVEVDSVVADIFGYAPCSIGYIAHSADAGLGVCDLGEITIHRLNRPSRDTHLTPALPYTKRFPCAIEAEGACSTCLGNLIFALERLHEKGLLSKGQRFFVGENAGISSEKDEVRFAIGQCAAEHGDAEISVDACPPSANTIYRHVESVLRDE
jgi:uncharacterized protein (DUF362 family)